MPSWRRAHNARVGVTAAAGLSGFDIWSGREDLNLDFFPGRKACCNYTTSAKPASYEPDTFVVWTMSRTIRAPHDKRAPMLTGRALPSDLSRTRHLQS